MPMHADVCQYSTVQCNSNEIQYSALHYDGLTAFLGKENKGLNEYRCVEGGLDMGRLERYYQCVQEFCRERDELEGQYEERMEYLKGWEGSERYVREKKQIDAWKMEADDALYQRYFVRLDLIRGEMEKAIRAMPMTAPSQEQLNILSLLRMRQHLTRDDFQRAANDLQGCPAALAVLEELAQQHEVLVPGIHSAMGYSVRSALDTLGVLTQNTLKLLKGQGSYYTKVSGKDFTETIARLTGMPNRVTEERSGIQRVSFDEKRVERFGLAADYQGDSSEAVQSQDMNV